MKDFFPVFCVRVYMCTCSFACTHTHEEEEKEKKREEKERKRESERNSQEWKLGKLKSTRNILTSKTTHKKNLT